MEVGQLHYTHEPADCGSATLKAAGSYQNYIIVILFTRRPNLKSKKRLSF